MKPNNIYCIDCLEGMKQLPSDSVDLICTDPPYNIDYHYAEYNDTKPDYWIWCAEWIKECFRVLKPTGSIYVKQFHRNIRFGVLLEDAGFTIRNTIIWKNVSCFPPKSRFNSAYELIFFATKTDKYTFNRYAETTKLEFRSWTPTRDDRLKGQLCDIWLDIKSIYTGSVNHPEVIFKEKDKLSRQSFNKAHPCQMPLDIARRIIKFSSNPGDLILDLFNGSGTTTRASYELNRQFIGFDTSEEYCKIARERLTQRRLI